MVDFFENFHPVMQALIATLFTWGMTALGATLVFATKTINQRLLDSMLGFAGGVMIAASYWSLLGPAIEMSSDNQIGAWFPAASGFLLGGIFLWGIDKILPHLHPNAPINDAEGLHPKGQKRSTLLVLAITLHNIPEGLAVGIAFGALANGGTEASLAGALTLALGIGIQNFPEGIAVSMPSPLNGIETAIPSGKFCGFNAVKRGRHVPWKELLLRAIFRDGRADCCSCWGSCGILH